MIFVFGIVLYFYRSHRIEFARANITNNWEMFPCLGTPRYLQPASNGLTFRPLLVMEGRNTLKYVPCTKVECKKQGNVVITRDSVDNTLDDTIRTSWNIRNEQKFFKSSLDGIKYKSDIASNGWQVELFYNPGLQKQGGQVSSDLQVEDSITTSYHSFLNTPSREFLFGFIPETIEDKKTSRIKCDSEGMTHAIFLNPYPLGNFSSIFLPYFWDEQPQQLSVDSIAISLALNAEIYNPSFRMAYDSMGAGAKINHLHFHLWYFDQSYDKRLPFERASVQFLAFRAGSHPEKNVRIDELINYPVKGLRFTWNNMALIDVAEIVMSCIDFLEAKEFPYTLIYTSTHLYLFPRKQSKDNKLMPFGKEINFAEIAGEIIVTDELRYTSTTAEMVQSFLKEQVSLTAGQFTEFKEHCTSKGPSSN